MGKCEGDAERGGGIVKRRGRIGKRWSERESSFVGGGEEKGETSDAKNNIE